MMLFPKTMPRIVTAFSFLLISCSISNGADDEKMADYAQQLQYVAAAVQGFVRFTNPPNELSGQGLLQEATKANPSLLNPLKGYHVTARHEGQFSSVLMCDADKKYAEAEDAGCTTTRLDAKLWNTPRRACAFVLDLQAVCAGK